MGQSQKDEHINNFLSGTGPGIALQRGKNSLNMSINELHISAQTLHVSKHLTNASRLFVRIQACRLDLKEESTKTMQIVTVSRIKCTNRVVMDPEILFLEIQSGSMF